MVIGPLSDLATNSAEPFRSLLPITRSVSQSIHGSLRMKRSVLLTGAIVAALSVGCANDQKKKDDAMANGDPAAKYHILNGSTADKRADEQQTADAAPEPQLNADSRFAAGMLAETQGRLDCAIIQYEQALRLNPNHVPSLYRLGVAHTK